MTEDIFDRIKGYEQFHEILKTFNKIMIETEKIDELSIDREWAEIHFKVKTPNGIIDLKNIETECERDMEHQKDHLYITFTGE